MLVHEGSASFLPAVPTYLLYHALLFSMHFSPAIILHYYSSSFPSLYTIYHMFCSVYVGLLCFFFPNHLLYCICHFWTLCTGQDRMTDRDRTGTEGGRHLCTTVICHHLHLCCNTMNIATTNSSACLYVNLLYCSAGLDTCPAG